MERGRRMGIGSAGNGAPLERGLTPAMLKALHSIYVGRPWGHLVGRSMHGGSDGTRHALWKRGLIEPSGSPLTDRGLLECHARFGGSVATRYDACHFLAATPETLDDLARDGVLTVHPRGGGAAAYLWRDLHSAKANRGGKPNVG